MNTGTADQSTKADKKGWKSVSEFNFYSVDDLSLDKDLNPNGLFVNINGNDTSKALFASPYSAIRASKLRSNSLGPSKKKLTGDELHALKLQKAWDMALSPAKSVPLNAFMLWMSGNTIQVFSVMVTAMMFYNAVKAILDIDTAFSRFDDVDTTGTEGNKQEKRELRVSSGPISQIVIKVKKFASDPLFLHKLAYFGLQLVLCGLGLYKMASMGLLPTASSDWLAFESYKPFIETVASGLLTKIPKSS